MKIISLIAATMFLSTSAMAQHGGDTGTSAPSDTGSTVSKGEQKTKVIKWICELKCEKGSESSIAMPKYQAPTKFKNLDKTVNPSSVKVASAGQPCSVSRDTLSAAFEGLSAAIEGKAEHCGQCSKEAYDKDTQCWNTASFPPKPMGVAMVKGLIAEQGASRVEKKGQ